jgi:hypothetical protein
LHCVSAFLQKLNRKGLEKVNKLQAARKAKE